MTRQLAYEIALESDSPDLTRKMREDALIRTLEHLIPTTRSPISELELFSVIEVICVKQRMLSRK